MRYLEQLRCTGSMSLFWWTYDDEVTVQNQTPHRFKFVQSYKRNIWISATLRVQSHFAESCFAEYRFPKTHFAESWSCFVEKNRRLLRIFNNILAGTLSYCNSEPYQHSCYVELGYILILQESPAIADKPARRESLPKIAPIRRAYNVVADNTGLSSCV